MLHETAFAETKGSGIGVMRRLLKETNLAPPTFRSDRGRDEFVATFFLHNLLDDEDLAWLSHFAALNLSTDETKSLVHVREAGQITNAAYRDLTGAGTLEASSHLRRLRDLKLLNQHNRGAATYYTPTERLLNPEAPSAVELLDPDASGFDAAFEQPGQHEDEGKSGKHRKQSDNLGGKSGNLRKQPDRLGEGNLAREFPAELADAISRLNLWTPQPDLRRLIQRLCAWRPLSTEELSEILGRSKTYLRTSYIGPMVKAGELAYTNPEKPNDPGQRYRGGKVAS